MKLKLISNINTINLKELKKTEPLSYAFYCLEKVLNNSGYNLIYINKDNNRVYFQLQNRINKKTSYIMDLCFEEILKMDFYLLEGIIREANI